MMSQEPVGEIGPGFPGFPALPGGETEQWGAEIVCCFARKRALDLVVRDDDVAGCGCMSRQQGREVFQQAPAHQHVVRRAAFPSALGGECDTDCYHWSSGCPAA